MAEITSLAVSAGKAAATAVAKPLWKSIGDRALGTAQQRRLDQICAETLDEVVRDGADPVQADHALSLLGLWFTSDVWPSLYATTAVEWAWRSTRSLDAAGVAVDDFPLNLQDVLVRLFVRVRQRLQDEAGDPESPLFNAVVLDVLARLAGQAAERIPLALALNRRLGVAIHNCRAANTRFRTPHLLLVLLADDSYSCHSALKAVRPGLDDDLEQQLREYTTRHWGEDFEPVEIDQMPEVRAARRLTQQECMPIVVEPHLMLAVLEADPLSTTVERIKELMGSSFVEMVAHVRAAPRLQVLERTPGTTLHNL